MVSVTEIMAAPVAHIGALLHLVRSANDPAMRRRYQTLPTPDQETIFAFVSLPDGDLEHAFVVVAREEGGGHQATREAIKAFTTRASELRAALARDRAAGTP